MNNQEQFTEYEDTFVEENLSRISEMSRQLPNAKNGGSDRIGKLMSDPMAKETSFAVDAIRAGLSRVEFDLHEIRSMVAIFLKHWDDLQEHIDFKTEAEALHNVRRVQHINGAIGRLRSLGVVPKDEEEDA